MSLKKIAAAMIGAALISASAMGATLKIHNAGDPVSLDPHKVSGTWENRVVSNMINGLMTIDAKGQVIYGQAESHTLSDDGLVYTFKLRDGLQWSDGQPVTAHDFEYSIKRLLNPETAAKYAWMQYTIKGAESYNKSEASVDDVAVKAVDDLTLEITLKEPTPFYLGSLTHYTAYAVPKHVVEKHGNEWIRLDNIAVNGPYKPTEWVPGSHVKLTKNDKFYDAENVKIDEVILYSLEDMSTILRSFLEGEVEWATRYPKNKYQELMKTNPEILQVEPYASLYYYLYNTKVAPLDDPEIRKALSYAVDKEFIAEFVVGTGEKAAYNWIPPNLNNYDEHVQPNVVDWMEIPFEKRQKEAKKILKSKGYDKKNPLKFTLRYNTSENHKRVAVAVAEMWKEIGVEVELYNTEVKVHYKDLDNHDFEIARAGWVADYNDPVNFLSLLITGTGNNYGQYSNAQYDQLLIEAGKETDIAKRAELLKSAEKILLDDFGALPIFNYVTENLVSPKLKGFEHNALDRHLIRWMSIEE